MPDASDDDPKKRTHANDPLHGVTVKAMVTTLVDELGWEEMAERARMNCFYENPSINSSLKFLRKTPWARERVERLYLRTMERKARYARRGPELDPGEDGSGLTDEGEEPRKGTDRHGMPNR